MTKILKARTKGSTIIEVIVAMVIVCFSVTLTMKLVIIHNYKSSLINRLAALELAAATMQEIPNKEKTEDVSDETKSVVYFQSKTHPDFPDCSIKTISVLSTDGRTLTVQQKIFCDQ